MSGTNLSRNIDAIPIFLCEIEQFGGAERSLLALSRWLTEQGRPNYFLTYCDHCNLAQYASHPIQMVVLNACSGFRNKMAALRRHFRDRPKTAPKPICSGYQPALHSTLEGLRGFHCLMHDTPSLFAGELSRTLSGGLRITVSNRLIGYGLGTGGKTIVTSEYLRSECRRVFRVDAEIARMGGISTSEGSLPAHPAPKSPADRLTMLSVCRVEENKRIDWMIRALAALERDAVSPLERPLSTLVDWHLELAGQGSCTAKLQALAQSLDIEHRIHFRGFVSDQALEAMYRESDLFLMPAIQGYGISAVEALRRGIPVLLHRDSGVSDLLLDTPWATVLYGGETELTPVLARAIDGVLRESHHHSAPPSVPTEDEWAEKVSTLCGWVS